MALAATISTSKAEDLVFTLKNNTNGTIERFFTSPVGVNNWEEDVFGADVIEPGESMEITIGDGRSVCQYDMRFEFTADSNIETLEDTQDLCAMGSYTISLSKN
ncbi:hypothetical protein ACQKGC_19855 [Allorhizobium pseudoryzae]|uniref:hypothetical protein n=1 Tax=Allorhizobium pseudoryzae TaxID=379684 RepID=UPI001F1BA2A8|nr:hypothetical protein [Allorhizobium pseudoryzae]